MQFKAAIILSVLTAASTTFAAPIHPHESALSRRDNHDTHHHHHARDLEEVQEIQARSPSPDIQAFGPPSQMTGGGYGGAGAWPMSPPSMPLDMPHGNFDGNTPRRKSHPRHYGRYARSLPEYMQELMERSPPLDLQELRADSLQDLTEYVGPGEHMGFHPPTGQMTMGGKGRRGKGRKGKGRPGQFFKRPLLARSLSGDVQELKARSLPFDGELEKRSNKLMGKLRDMVKGSDTGGIVHKLHQQFANGRYNTGGWTPRGRHHYARSLPEDGQVLEARSPFYEDRKSVV